MNVLERLEHTGPYRSLREGLNRKLISWMSEEYLHSLGSKLKVAELACGSAYGSSLLAESDSVEMSVGLDLNMALFVGEPDAEKRKSAVCMVQGDLLKPPFVPESFDFVWSSSSIEHFPDPASGIASMARLLKSGGLLFVGVPYVWGPLAGYFLTPDAGWREWIGKPFTYAQLEKCCRDAGVEPLGRRTYFFRFFCGIMARKP